MEQASHRAEKPVNFVILSGAKNLSAAIASKKKDRFLAPLGMTKTLGTFAAACETCTTEYPEKN